jgi:hypothetical protein
LIYAMNTTAGPILRCRHEVLIAPYQFQFRRCVALAQTRLGHGGMSAFWPKVDVQADNTGHLITLSPMFGNQPRDYDKTRSRNRPAP